MVSKVRKRNDNTERFSYRKLYNSINKSIKHTGKENKKLAKELADDVVKVLNRRFKKKNR